MLYLRYITDFEAPGYFVLNSLYHDVLKLN